MTFNQQLASDPNRSVWVSASAGTGKTKVLTDRVLRLLLAGAEPGSILCVTFTKAAAAEMLARIEHQLGRWAVMDDAALRASVETLTAAPATDALLSRARELFARVLDAPERLRVQTIHSFCQSVIARFPLEAGVPPHVTLLDERDSSEMLAEARLKIFTDAVNAPGSVLSRTVQSLSQSISETTLAELLQAIVAQRHAFSHWLEQPGGVERFVLRLHETLGLPPGTNEARLVQRHFSYASQQEEALRAACATLLAAAQATNRSTGAAIAAWMEKREDVHAYVRALLTKDDTPRVWLCTKKLGEAQPELLSLLAHEAERAVRFQRDYHTLRVIQSSEAMFVLAEALLGHYREEKTRRGVMDYEDLILLTVRLLRDSSAAAWVLFKLDGSLDHLLVDEAQDTSPGQWQIVEALVSEFFSGETAREVHRTLFVVGDEKQSIYSFQGADPAIFDRMRRQLSRRAEEAGKLFSHVRLDTSFRSTETVLAAVDAVFACGPAREGLVFSESDISHQAHRKGQAGRVEVWPLVEVEAQPRPSPWDRLEEVDYAVSAQQKMARILAAEIGEWLKEGRLLASQGRPVRPGDIMILLQRRGTFAGAMVRELKRLGIPVAGADRLIVTDHIAVKDCLALADFLLLPQDDLTLAGLLKSPFLGVTEEQLFLLAHDRGSQSLWQRLREHPAFAPHAHFLSDMLARADYMRPYELFMHALVTLGKREAILARLGHEAEDPLGEFLTQALHYERMHPPSLQGFLHWLRRSDSQIKRDMEKGRDEVRILTVHASKGLQAPVIFLADTTFVPRPLGNLQWLGDEPSLPLWSGSAKEDNAALQQLKAAARTEDHREYHRLLYVAMTRAEDELYICGWKGSKAIAPECWYGLARDALTQGREAGEDGRYRLVGGTLPPCVREAGPLVPGGHVPSPAWIRHHAPQEPRPSRPLSPSRMEAPSRAAPPQLHAAARARGVLVHRLLQYLPDAPPSAQEELIAQFSARYGAELSLAEKASVKRQVQNLLSHPEFAPVFAPGSVAEVPVAGVVRDAQGQPVTLAGQIDRLAVLGDEVLIIDFKTGRDIPPDADAVPAAYRQQMDAYRRLMQDIYPEKTIKCGLLWTSGPTLILLPQGG